MAERDDDEEFDLGISLESVAAIADAARAVQEGEESGAIARDEEDEEGLDADDDENMDEDALRAFIAELNEDEQASLIALAWVGRGDYSGEEFEEARTLGEGAQHPRSGGIPARHRHAGRHAGGRAGGTRPFARRY